MSPRTILVTGASRGIGLALTRHLLAAGHVVVASCRTPAAASELLATGAPVVGLDVTDPASVGALAAAVRNHVGHVDVLVNNAAINHVPGAPRNRSMGPLAELDPEAVGTVLQTNVVGVLAATQAVLPLLRRPGGIIVNISSTLSSFTHGLGVDYSYNPSKTALNMVTVIMQRDLGAQGLSAVAVDPGWIRTEMGGADAPLDVEDATADLAALLARIDASFGGTFVDRHGDRRDW